MIVYNEAAFQKARLIPITGIKGAQDQEMRATSALLAIMKVVPELAHVLLAETGSPKGLIETYIEPEFKLGQKRIRPDGLIVISRGKKTWRALVEVKTGKNPLDLNQLNSYLEICKDYKLDALVTISNEVLNASGAHPTEGIDLRKLRSTELLHLSWLKIITEALVLSEHVGVQDTERDFVLRELIRFLQSDSSGAAEFNDMGPAWPSVRNAVKSHALSKPDPDTLEIVSRFESLIRYAAMTLSARLGVSVKEVVPRSAKDDYKKHLQISGLNLIQNQELAGEIFIPGAAANLLIRAHLGSELIHVRFTVAAPSEGRNKARLNWLLRQIKDAPARTSIAWTYKRARTSENAYLASDLADKTFEYQMDNSREISSFTVELVSKMGTKRGAGQGGFIDSVVDSCELVYGELLQGIRAFQPASPHLSDSVKDLIPDRAGAERGEPN